MAVVVALWTHFGTRKGSHSWWELAEVRSKPGLPAETLVDLNIDSLAVTVVWSDVIKEMDDKPRQWLEHLLQGRHISGEVKDSVFKVAFGVVQRGLGTLAGTKARAVACYEATIRP